MLRKALFTVLALVLVVVAPSCQDESIDTDQPESSALTFSIDPPEGALGTSMRVTVSASRSGLSLEETSVDFGEGITVESVTVIDGWTAFADIDIALDAETGKRDVTLAIGETEHVLAKAFRVNSSTFSVTPDNARIGETIDVEIVGTNTQWLGGRTWINFGDGIDVLELTVLSETILEATIAVRSDAHPGTRDVFTEDGPKVVTAYDVFTVDRVGLAATWDPETAEQGTTVEYTIVGRDTNFQEDLTELTFLTEGREVLDIVVDDVHVIDAQNMWGHITLSNAAVLGLRDVLVESGDEGVLIPDAFEVVGGDLALGDVAIGLSFTVTRGIDNDTGTLSERVSAGASFVIPLDPPCGSSPPPGAGPMPYDLNGVFPVPDPVESNDDCPTPQTVSAGDFVWLESDANTVTLTKQIDASTGSIYYIGEDLTMADYVPDQLYDLHLQGDPDGLPEELLPGVQPTVPADWELLTPELWGNYTHDRAQDFDYTWTPAETYPDAIFYTSISGTLVETGKSGFAGSFPWDDGVHTYTGEELSQLEASPVSFTAYSYIEGPEFGLKDSKYQTNVAKSYIYLSASMILE